MSRPAILHREQAGLWPIWLWIAVTAAAFAAFVAAGDANHGYGLLMASAVLGLFIPLVVSGRRYSSVTLTADELRVGRQVLDLRDLDPGLLEQQVDGRAELPNRLTMDLGEGVKVAGGAWGPTFGQRHLLMRLKATGAVTAVPTRDPAGLARGVLDALGG